MTPAEQVNKVTQGHPQLQAFGLASLVPATIVGLVVGTIVAVISGSLRIVSVVAAALMKLMLVGLILAVPAAALAVCWLAVTAVF